MYKSLHCLDIHRHVLRFTSSYIFFFYVLIFYVAYWPLNNLCPWTVEQQFRFYRSPKLASLFAFKAALNSVTSSTYQKMFLSFVSLFHFSTYKGLFVLKYSICFSSFLFSFFCTRHGNGYRPIPLHFYLFGDLLNLV